MNKAVKYTITVLGILFILVGLYSIITNPVVKSSIIKKPITTEPTATVKPTAATPSPIAHIYGHEPLIILDCSKIIDNDIFKDICEDINAENNTEGIYIKSDKNLEDAYSLCLSKDIMPTVIIAANSQLDKLRVEYIDISEYADSLNLNSKAREAVTKDYLPFSLLMYGYYVREDIIHELDLYAVRLYDDILSSAQELKSQDGRYGMGVAANGIGAQMILVQMDKYFDDDGETSLFIFNELFDELLLPPDMGYWDDSFPQKAYINDACAMVYSDGYLLDELKTNHADLYSVTNVISYLNNDKTFCAQPISSAVLEGGNAEIAYEFMNRAYDKIDKIIIGYNIGMLNVGMEKNTTSPFKNALKESSDVLLFHSSMDNSMIIDIIFHGLAPTP